MPVKILLLNVHSYRNNGDLALNIVTIQQLKANFPGCQITLAVNDLDSYFGEDPAINSHLPWLWQGERGWRLGRLAWLVPATLIPILFWRLTHKSWFGLTPQYLKPLVQAYLESDIAVSTAGGFFRTTGTGLTLFLTAYAMILAVWAGKPLYVFPQSFEPFHHAWQRRLIKWLFSKARIIMAREPNSMENLANCGVDPSHCVLVPDVAFGFKGETSEAAQAWLRANRIEPDRDRPLLGMTVIDWAVFSPNREQKEAYEEAIIAVIRLFIEHYQGKVLILPQTWGPTQSADDRIPAKRIASKLPELCESILAPQTPLNAMLLQAVFGEMDMVIGTRLHSNIFSISRGVPVLLIAYETKSIGIAKLLGMENWVIDIRETDPATLTKKFEELWKQRDQVRASIRKKLPEIIKQSQAPGQLVAADYARINKAPTHA